MGSLGREGVTLRERDVADIGAGDGIIDLGLAIKAQPRKLVGFDIESTDEARLVAQAREHGVAQELPSNLEFRRSEAMSIPAGDDSFDIVLSWSAFEHVGDPPALLREVRRIVRSNGTFFLQIWPLYHSEHGGHLWDWFPDEPFLALRRSPGEIEKMVKAIAPADPTYVEDRLRIFRTLNRLTLDDLQRALLGAGFEIKRVEVTTNAVRVPEGLDHEVRLSDLLIAGVMLIAIPS